MSFKKPTKLSNRARVVYPAIIQMEDGHRNTTGPYRKDLHGENFENVKSYLVHMMSKYDEAKAKQMETIKKMLNKADPK